MTSSSEFLAFLFIFLASTSMMQSTANTFDYTLGDSVAVEKDHKFCSPQVLKCNNNCLAREISTSPKLCICPIDCRKNCTTDEFSLKHLEEFKNPHNPCETFFCDDGIIRTHISSCSVINCDPQHRIRPVGACCEICDENLSNFCDDEENRECEIACQFSFVRDERRNCDLCRCTRGKTSTTTERIEEEKIERNLENFVYFFIAFVAVFVFGSFLMILIYFVRIKIYKKIPLISQRDVKRGSNCNSETMSTSVSGCESV